MLTLSQKPLEKEEICQHTTGTSQLNKFRENTSKLDEKYKLNMSPLSPFLVIK
jgi:hypothetical protein